MSFDKAAFVLGSPSFVFESAASSIARVVESFGVEEAVVFFSEFAQEEALRVQRFAERLFGVKVSLKPLPGSLGEAKETLAGALTKDSVAVPTAGSVLGAVALTHAADRVGASIVHVMFPFGPWTGLFYPYVPRYLQPILVIGRAEVKPRAFDAKQAENFLGDKDNTYITTKLSRALARVSLKLNSSLRDLWVNDTRVPELALELCDEVGEKSVSHSVYLKTPQSSVQVCKLAETPRQPEARTLPLLPQMQKSTRCLVGTGSASREAVQRLFLEAFYTLASGREACLRSRDASREQAFKSSLGELYSLAGFELLTLNPYGVYVVDTNLVYMGIHNLVRPGGPRIIVPYCVRYEILDKLTHSKSPCARYTVLLAKLALEALEGQASRLPSNAASCDMAIPAVDPELLKGATLLSADRLAVDLWKSMVLSRYTEVKLVRREDFRPATGAELHYAVAQLAAMLCYLRGYARRKR